MAGVVSRQLNTAGIFAIAAGICVVQPAHAQSAVPSPPAAGDKRDADAPQTDALGDIIVTATRRDERLQDVPISITALSGETLTKGGVNNTLELTQKIPGLVFSRGNAAMQPVIRGVGTKSSGAGDESNVAVYLDGVYQADPASQLMDLGASIERVEVLRGPQGTLFGRNATGGLINIITKQPSHDTQFLANLRYGNFNERSAEVYTTFGLTSTLSMNFSGLVLQDDGYLTNLLTGRKIGGRNEYVARAKLLWEPAANFRLTVMGSYSYLDDASQIYNEPLNGNASARALAKDPRTVIGTRPYQIAVGPTYPLVIIPQNKSASANAVWNLGSVNLENTFGFSRTITSEVIELDNTPFDGGHIVIPNGIRSRYFSDETRLVSTGAGPLSYVAGVFLFSGRGDFDSTYVYLSGNAPFTKTTASQRARSAAVFGEITYKLGDNLKVVGGLRYTTETRRLVGETFTYPSNAITAAVDTQKTFSKLTYRGIIQYDLDRFGNFYASISRGFKSGVFNANSTAPTSVSTRPEVLDAYEIGMKSDPLPWLRLNASVFLYKYKDIQLNARSPLNPAIAILQNAASATIKGAEAEVTIKPSQGFLLTGFLTYLDAKYDSFPAAQIYTQIYQDQTSIGLAAAVPIGNAASLTDESGRYMIKAPKMTLGASFDYSHEFATGALDISGTVYYTSKYYWDFNNRLTQPAYTLVNGQISWTLPDKRLKVSLWVRNLTDRVYYQYMSASTAGDYVAFARPRSFGASVGITL